MPIPSVEELLENALLAKLHRDDLMRLVPHMLVFDFAEGHTLQRAGEEVCNTWFPSGSAMAAFLVGSDETRSVEVALIGREGAIGGIVSNGFVPAFASSRVAAAGRFFRIKTRALEEAKLESIALRHWLSRYSDCLIAQLLQTAACNATHTIAQRTAKWLLAAGARTKGSTFRMTHEQLAEMLGVGRTFVTRTIGQLRAEGLIATGRGLFTVLDEARLRARSCACTTAIEEHFDTVLHGIYPLPS
ncbi:Crp/Fnr family transcriptional regulator [Acidocella sp.]|uniref:Crp/Fnr family transcriptional regulator n=1 Tax=Acidocella sp. TaxID=50710 RepID=UPI00260CE90E|nr:Crp/Fnr family transcriptional regulator [Acidocella sp.]